MSSNRIIKTVLIVFASSIVLSGIAYSQSAPPSNLEVSSEENVVHLKWQAPETDSRVTYNIYKAEARSLSSTVDPTQLEFSKLSSVIETSYEDKIDDANEDGQLYVYYVVAVNSEGMESAGSNYVNVKVGESQTDEDMY